MYWGWMARSACGRVGYGEGCPRHYVTGETVQSGIAFIQQHAEAIVANIQDLDGLKNWIDANRGVLALPVSTPVPGPGFLIIQFTPSTSRL